MGEGIGVVIGVVFLLLGWAANFYLWGQWVVYPRMRRRFRVCKPYLAIGWVLWFVGGSILAPLGRGRQSDILVGAGGLVGLVGIGLTLLAAVRLLRSNAAERRAVQEAVPAESAPGTWPPPPQKQ